MVAQSIGSKRGAVGRGYPTISVGSGSGRLQRALVRAAYAALLIGAFAAVAFMGWKAIRYLQLMPLAQTQVQVIPLQPQSLFSPVEGIARLERPFTSGEFMEQGTVLMTIESRKLQKAILLKECEANCLSRQRQELEAARLKERGRVELQELDREIRRLSQSVLLNSEELRQLNDEQQRLQIRAPISGWLIGDLEHEFYVSEGGRLCSLAPAHGETLLRVEAPLDLVDKLSTQQGFRVKLVTDSGVEICDAVRSAHPIQTNVVIDDDDTRALWTTFFATIRTGNEPRPGLNGMIVDY